MTLAGKAPTLYTKPGDLPVEPFPGPRPFCEGESQIFFGREQEIRDLRNLVLSYPVVLLYSQSGSGKTSLIQAGLLPALLKDGIAVLANARVAGVVSPSVSRDTSVNIYARQVLSTAFNGKVDLSLSLAETLANAVEPRDQKSGAPSRQLLILDQFEEFFTAFPERWKDREGFLAQLSSALTANRDLRLLIVLREEFLAELESYSEIVPYNLRIRYRLERLREDDALCAIEGPLDRFGCTIDHSAAERLLSNLKSARILRGSIVEEVEGEFIEPVQLQVVCRDLWLRRDATSRGLIVPDKFDEVDDALASFYQTSVKRAMSGAKVTQYRVRTWFDKELITSRGTRRIVFKGDKETGGLGNAAVHILESQHIVRLEPRAGGEVCELTHDRFIAPIKRSNEIWFRRRRLYMWPLYAAFGALFVCLACAWAVDQLHERSMHNAELLVNKADKELHDRTPNAPQALADYKHALNIYDSLKGYKRDVISEKLPNIYAAMGSICSQDPSTSGCSDRSGFYLCQARHYHQASRRDDLVLDDDLALGRLLFREGATADALGFYSDAETLLGSASSTTDSMSDRDPAILASIMAGIGGVHLRRAAFPRAREDFANGLRALGRTNEFGQRSELWYYVGVTWLAEGDYKKAHAIFESFSVAGKFNPDFKIDEPSRLLRVLGLSESLLTRTPTHSASEQLRKAYNDPSLNVAVEDENDQSRRRQKLQHEKYEQGANCVALAEYLINNQRYPEAINKADEAKAIYSMYDDPVNVAVASALQARALFLNQKASSLERKMAEQEAKSALTVLEKAQYRLGVAYDLETLALMNSADDTSNSQAVDLLRRAYCIYKGVHVSSTNIYLKTTEQELTARKAQLDPNACFQTRDPLLVDNVTSEAGNVCRLIIAHPQQLR